MWSCWGAGNDPKPNQVGGGVLQTAHCLPLLTTHVRAPRPHPQKPQAWPGPKSSSRPDSVGKTRGRVFSEEAFPAPVRSLSHAPPRRLKYTSLLQKMYSSKHPVAVIRGCDPAAPSHSGPRASSELVEAFCVIILLVFPLYLLGSSPDSFSWLIAHVASCLTVISGCCALSPWIEVSSEPDGHALGETTGLTRRSADHRLCPPPAPARQQSPWLPRSPCPRPRPALHRDTGTHC